MMNDERRLGGVCSTGTFVDVPGSEGALPGSLR
jgi:hypothetical protein